MNKVTQAKIVDNESLTDDIFLISLEIPEPIESKPGQFCILRMNERLDPLLGRPFSIFDYEGNIINFLYRVKGKGTEILSKMDKDQNVLLTGPLGRWYPYPEKDFVVIAGGIGLASVYYLMKKFRNRAYFFCGGRSEQEILFYNEVKTFAKEVYISTEYGTTGYRGVVTDLFKEKGLMLNLPVYACGPMVMLKELKRIVQGSSIPCYVAVEERMACGIGACLGCAIETREGLKRVCTDGPIFELKELML